VVAKFAFVALKLANEEVLKVAAGYLGRGQAGLQEEWLYLRLLFQLQRFEQHLDYAWARRGKGDFFKV
jgi:hypothetical protein